jgi:hypothetical protein
VDRSIRRQPAGRRRPETAGPAARRNLYLLTGIVGETVTDLSQWLLAEHGGLRGLFQMDVAELSRMRALVHWAA